jgi:hypothetical protein
VHHDAHEQFPEVGHGDPVELIAGRYEPGTGTAGEVLGPARDTLSGGTVTVLRSPAPADALTRFQELDRLRRYAGSRHPALAGIRAVELLDDEFRVVCDPVTGVVLEPGAPPADLTVDDVRNIAAGLLDAVAALHLAGVPQGWVRPGAVVVRRGPSGAAVTLLPLPVAREEAAVASSAGSAGGERQLAATLLLCLLRRIPVERPAAEAEAHRLRVALTAAGGTAEQPWGPPGSALFPPVHRRRAPVPLSSSATSLAPLAPVPAPGDQPPPPRSPLAGRPRRGRPSRRAVLEGSAAGIAVGATIAVVVAAAALAGHPGSHRGSGAPPDERPAVTTPAAPSSGGPAPPSRSATPSPST